MTKCKYSDTYKAIYPPKCKPLCDVCKKKWRESEKERGKLLNHMYDIDKWGFDVDEERISHGSPE